LKKESIFGQNPIIAGEKYISGHEGEVLDGSEKGTFSGKRKGRSVKTKLTKKKKKKPSEKILKCVYV